MAIQIKGQVVIDDDQNASLSGSMLKKGCSIPSSVVTVNPPPTPEAGDFWTDISGESPILKVWNGTEWIEFSGGGPSGPVGAIVEQPQMTADNLNYAPATITATPPVMANSSLFSSKWYKDGVEIEGAGGFVLAATQPGTYRYEETWGDEAGNILRPDVSIVLLDLDIQRPVVTAPSTPLNPAYATFVASEPAVDLGDINTWGTATWEVSTTTDFVGSNTYTETIALTASGTQSSPYFTQLDAVTGYYVRVKYGSSLPAGVESEFSNPAYFTTSESYNAIQSVTALNEGNSVTFNISTDGVSSGTTLYYTIEGTVNPSDFTDNATQGNFSIQNDSASVTKTLMEDGTTEGIETFVFKIHTGSYTGPVVYQSSTVTVYDTSKTVYIGTYKFQSPSHYSTTGGNWNVPANTTYIQVMAWGSGGEPDGYPNGFPGGDGGGGGFAQAVIPVTPGESLSVAVGESRNNGGGSNSIGTGHGGGFSGIFRGSTPLIIAGGGGGGAVNNTNRGGSGGGYSGGSSSDGNAGGGQSGPSHRYLQGGSGSGGGGGYYGGEGSSWSNAGGGGSGYVSASGNLHTTMSNGSGRSPGGTGHADYDQSYASSGRQYGQGGSGNNGGDQTYGHGLIVIHALNSDYNPSSNPILPSQRNIIQTY